MSYKLKQPLAREDGFTLIELLVVVLIIGILLAIAIPSYLGFRGKAQDTRAEANIRAALPAAEAFYSANNTYTGMDLTAMRSFDQGVDANLTVSVISSGSRYCLKELGQTGAMWYVKGPGGTITSNQPTGCP